MGIAPFQDFLQTKEPNQEHDIGYFNAEYGGLYGYNSKAPYTIESFIVNPWSFSDEKQDEFLRILHTKGLKPQSKACIFGSRITWRTEDHKEWDERPLLYK